MVVIRSVVVFGQSGCIFLKLVVFGQKWFIFLQNCFI